MEGIWAYGSRVNGNAYDGCDLDLVLRATDLQELPPIILNCFHAALTEGNLPICMDAHDWARLPTSLRKRILQRYEVLRPAQVAAFKLPTTTSKIAA